MSFTVKNTGNGDGTYTLSYGKGKGKLSDIMDHDDTGWFTMCDTERLNFSTMRECKEAWSEWAAGAYSMTEEVPLEENLGSGEPIEADRSSTPPPPRRRTPPPPARTSRGEQPLSKVPAHQRSDERTPPIINNGYWLHKIQEWHEAGKPEQDWKQVTFEELMMEIRNWQLNTPIGDYENGTPPSTRT